VVQPHTYDGGAVRQSANHTFVCHVEIVPSRYGVWCTLSCTASRWVYCTIHNHSELFNPFANEYWKTNALLWGKNSAKLFLCKPWRRMEV